MKATEYAVQFVVTVEFLLLDGQSFSQHESEIRERVIAQLAGHRTPKRLADTATVEVEKITATSREAI